MSSLHSHSRDDFKYPSIRRVETTFTNAIGCESTDPYQWMEDPCPELEEFITQENEIFSKYIGNSPIAENIRRRMTALSDHEKYSNPMTRGGRYYYLVNSAKQHHHEEDCLYVQDSINSQPRMFLDPYNIPGVEEPGHRQLRIYSFSTDGELFAYGLSVNNSNCLTIRFKSAITEEIFPDVLQRVKESDIAWLADNKGIFYSCNSADSDNSSTDGKNQSLLYHALGTDQKEDVVIMDLKIHAVAMIRPQVSDCGEFLIIAILQDPGTSILFYTDLLNAMNTDFKEAFHLIPLITKYDSYFEYITNVGTSLYLRTNQDAKNYQIIVMNLKEPDNGSLWVSLIGEHPRNVLDWAECVNNNFLLICYIRDVKHTLQLRRLDNGVLLYTFPLDIGTITDHFAEKNSSEILFTFTSFVIPDKIYRADLLKFDPMDEKRGSCTRSVFGKCMQKPTMCLSVFKAVELPDFKASEFVTKQIFYKCRNRQVIPMFIVHKKSLKRNGKAPCILYGYGGFGGFVVPSFSISRIPFIQNFNGVFALASIRGGGEYGQKWYDAGRMWGKQCSVEDLIDAAEYLISEQYTSAPKLVVEGRRNGGLIAATCVNQRPDLFGAAIINEGILDLLRFHLSNEGQLWMSDYGNPNDATDYIRLCKLSPLHNVKTSKDNGIKYPAILVLTSKIGTEVATMHSYKYIATLQHELGSHLQQIKPFLLRVLNDHREDDVIHTNTQHLINKRTDIYSFLIKSLEYRVQNL